MGMVIIVISIVVFDKVLGRGRLSADLRQITADDSLAYQERADNTASSGLGQAVSYLSLKGGEDNTGAWLGIEAVDLSKDTAEKLGLNISGGVLISRVIENSPAEEAGLLRGDIIWEFDRRDVKGVDELVKLLGGLDSDARVKVVLFREGERVVVYVKLGKAAETTSSSTVRQIAGDLVPSDQKWGIAVSELTESLRRDYDIPNKEEGVVVVMVAPGSAADKAALKKGDLIQQVDRSRVQGLAEFFEALQSSSDHILLNVYRGGVELYVHVIAVSPFMQVGGPPDPEEDDDEDEGEEGLKGPPGQIPPLGKPESAALEQVQGVPTAQEGIGMNRPLYVPGYDQTQSGEPDEKTRSLTENNQEVVGDDTDSSEEAPVLKRIQELNTFL